MSDIIVSDKDLNIEGEIMTIDEFIEQAEKGIEVDSLTIDVSVLCEELYESIMEGIEDSSGIRFVTTDGIIPDYINEKVEHIEIKNKDKNEEENKEVKEENKEIKKPSESVEDDIYKVGSDVQIALRDEIIRHSKQINEDFEDEMRELINQNSKDETNNKRARTYLFGSSKGGTGKTFTCLICAYRYAKLHPQEKVAVCDFDITDGQVGITIHRTKSTVYDFYKQWKLGYKDFNTMKNCLVKTNRFPKNVDFYLAPKDNPININAFWEDVLANLITNYDVVYFDSGIDYMNYPPISTLYKIADKILLMSTTSIKSVSSVTKQIARLKGKITNNVFSEKDEIGKRLNLVVTQIIKNDPMNNQILGILKENVNIVGLFPVLTAEIQRAEYLEEWDIFDNVKQFNETLDKINA